MPQLLKALKKFLFTLFFGDPVEVKKKNELKKIYRILAQSRLHYYKVSTQQILPPFAHTVFKLSTYVMPLRELYNKTINNENSNLREKFKDYLVDVKLDEDTRLMKQVFAYESIKSRIENSPSVKDEVKRLEHDFSGFMRNFDSPLFKDFDLEFSRLDLFAALTRHDFEKLLTFFDAGINLFNSKQKPKFSPIIGKYANQELMDIYFLIAGLQVDNTLAEQTNHLFNRLKKSAGDREKLKIKKIVETIGEILRTSLSPEILLNLLKAINEDPNLVLPSDKETKNYLETYKNRMTANFQRDKDKVIRETNEQAVRHQLNQLFGNTELLEIEYYQESLSQELQACHFPTFDFIKPLRIVKSYTVILFEHSIKEIIKQLIIEGFFEDRDFKNQFEEIFHETQNAYDMISEFESNLSEPGEVSIHTIKKYLEKFAEGKPVENALGRLIETINRRAGEIIEEVTNIFYLFLLKLKELISDYKEHNPTIVSNIKVIKGERNQEFITHLITAYNNTVKFVAIMQNFTYLHKSIEKKADAF